MGGKPSKRSVDITTTPKKGEGDSPIEGEGKVEKIGDLEAKITTNGAVHTEIEYAVSPFFFLHVYLGSSLFCKSRLCPFYLSIIS